MMTSTATPDKRGDRGRSRVERSGRFQKVDAACRGGSNLDHDFAFVADWRFELTELRRCGNFVEDSRPQSITRPRSSRSDITVGYVNTSGADLVYRECVATYGRSSKRSSGGRGSGEAEARRGAQDLAAYPQRTRAMSPRPSGDCSSRRLK
jgi:hypothetical protein